MAKPLTGGGNPVASWSQAATMALVDAWACHHNWEAVAASVSAVQPAKTVKQCKWRMDILKKIYNLLADDGGPACSPGSIASSVAPTLPAVTGDDSDAGSIEAALRGEVERGPAAAGEASARGGGGVAGGELGEGDRGFGGGVREGGDGEDEAGGEDGGAVDESCEGFRVGVDQALQKTQKEINKLNNG